MATAPYDQVDVALNMARVRLNDAIQSLGGDILTDTQPFTLQFANNAWRRLQAALVNLGFARFQDETIITALPATSGGADAGSQVSLAWTGYNPGSGLNAGIALPQSLISPLSLWERISGSNTQYLTMDQVYNGLPRVPQDKWNKLWEWREETIWMPGATGTTDLLIRFASYLPDFSGGSWQTTPVPLMRSVDPLAWYICSEVARSRGDMDATYFDQMADTTMQQVFDRDSAEPKMIAKPAEWHKMKDRYTLQGQPTGGQ